MTEADKYRKLRLKLIEFYFKAVRRARTDIVRLRELGLFLEEIVKAEESKTLIKEITVVLDTIQKDIGRILKENNKDAS